MKFSVRVGIFFLAGVLCASSAETFNASFDFTRLSGDRDHYFGERQPDNTFDVNGSSSSGLAVVSAGYLNAQNKLAVWLELDDPEPDTVNGSQPADASGLWAGTNVTARTRIQYLYCGANYVENETASAGILFCLTGSGATRSGYLARVERPYQPTTGTSGSRLVIDAFTNGVRGARLAESADFAYGVNSTPCFMELQLNGTNATVKLFSDVVIPGSGNAASRLTDAAFDSAASLADLSFTLDNPADGFLALYAEDNSNMTANNPANGVIRFSNFHASFDVSPPTPLIRLAATSRLAIEGGADGAFTLTRGGKINVPVTVTYAMSGTASNGTDYVSMSGTVSFAAGQTEAVVYIHAPDDSTVEFNETVTLTLNADSSYEIIGLGSSSILISDPNPGDYSLLNFNDEFEGASLDTSIWAIHSGRTNVAVQSGNLELITGQEGADWKTGSIQTPDFAGKYGYYEARLKVNDASGLNNAFWLNTPGDMVSGNSVDRMEVDITEAHYYDNQSHMTLHDWAPVHWGSGTIATIPDISADFHAVGLEWKNDNTLIWSWDGVEKRALDASTFLSADSMIPLSVLCSTLVTSFAGAPGSGLEGSKMLIDYVRVWQKPGWTGAVNGNWGSSPNWGPDGVPGSGKAAVFNGPSANTSVTLAADKSCHSLYFDNADCAAYTLAAGAYDLHLGAAVDGVGGITINTPVIRPQTLDVDLVADRDLQFGNFSRSGDATLFLNGDIDAPSAGKTLQFCGFSPIEVGGALSANIGPVTKWGVNTVRFAGANAHTGLTDVQDGALVIGSSSALGSTSAGTLVSSGASLVFAGGVQYTNPEPVTVGGGGDDDWQGALDVEGAGIAVFNGPITLSADATFSGGSDGGGLELNGSISGAYTITKAGEGVLNLNGTSDAALILSDGQFVGGGIINNDVTISGGAHAPEGIQEIHGTYTLAAAGVLSLELNSTTADQLQVFGDVVLAGTLEIAAVPGMAVGSVFTLIDNDGADAVSGTFAGLTNNAEFSADGYSWRVNYDGGDGNDVTLTVLSGGEVPVAYVVADFNDMERGAMTSAVQPAGTGQGFSSDYWESNTAVMTVTLGDLYAWESTEYGVVQTGASQCVRTGTTYDRRQARTMIPVSGNGSDIWFSFLARSAEPTDVAGIDFLNSTSYNVASTRNIHLHGRTLIVDGTQTNVSAKSFFGETTLIVGKMTLGSVADPEELSVWINPVLSSQVDLESTTPDFHSADMGWNISQLEVLGICSYDTQADSSDGGTLDAVRISNGTDAFDFIKATAGTLPANEISRVPMDLHTPLMTNAPPAPGLRVKATLSSYAGTDVYHALYLPTDWEAGGKYPVIVEYAGNGPYLNSYGDLSYGTVEGSNLGYGISGGKGFIWICMPFISKDLTHNQLSWWGDIDASIAYCKDTVAEICSTYGGDSNKVFLAGFSRGAIACNYIGLHDDSIAALWRGFIAYSHYDGEIETWGYPEADRASAAVRFARLGGRPQFICRENSVAATQSYLQSAYPDGNFTFQDIQFRNHNDTWVLRDIPERTAVRKWLVEAAGIRPSLQLQAGAADDEMEILWPDTLGDYVLQSTTNLAPVTAWTAATNYSVVLSNSIYRVQVPYGGSNRFFRLVWP